MKSYNRFYYEEHRNRILVSKQIKRTNDYIDFKGHVKLIYEAIRRYASQWHISIDKRDVFRRWATADDNYIKLYNVWKETGYLKELAPVVMRKVKKRGFVEDNLYWSTKSQHPWWSGEIDRLHATILEMEKKQVKQNKASPEEQEEMRNRMLAKRKGK